MLEGEIVKILHVMAGLGETSGVANVARRFARVQSARGDEVRLLAPARKWNPVYFDFAFAMRAGRAARDVDEIWVHCSWTFPVWYGAWVAKRFGKRLVVVPEASFDPRRLDNASGWKKRLVAPLDRWVLRQADEVLALCTDEVGWIRAFEPSARVRFTRVPTFCGNVPVQGVAAEALRCANRPLHVLFLGRAADPLKGLAYLEQSVRALNERLSLLGKSESRGIELRVVSNAVGAEKEAVWNWCDVLCLPTLSDNFGLVVAEALERGKPVVTTDGAPAWKNEPRTDAHGRTRLVYLEGYRDGADAQRVELLKRALGLFLEDAARGAGGTVRREAKGAER